MLRAAKSLAVKCHDRASRGRVEKRAGAIERCKRAPNVSMLTLAVRNSASTGHGAKSTGDIDLAKTPKAHPKSSIN